MTRRDRIIRLAKLRGDKAALAIAEGPKEAWEDSYKRHAHELRLAQATESELRAMWGDR
jgi:hypothetical protein